MVHVTSGMFPANPASNVMPGLDRISTELTPTTAVECSRCLTLTRQGSMCGAPKLFYHAAVHLKNFNRVIKYRGLCGDAVLKNILEPWKCGYTRRYYRAHMSFAILTISPRTVMECLRKIAPNNAPLYKFTLSPCT